MIECTTFYGGKKLISKNKLMLRPSVYAIIVNDDNVLVINMRNTGKLFLPGGGIEVGERIEDALKREVREEVGIEIELEKFAQFKEDFFYYDPEDRAYHALIFFYVCKPKTFELLNDAQIQDDEAEHPHWLAINSLKNDMFHCHAETILEILQTCHKSDQGE